MVWAVIGSRYCGKIDVLTEASMDRKALIGFVVAVSLVSGCSSTSTPTSAATDVVSVPEVAQPSPGVDIDRVNAVGQVVDTLQDSCLLRMLIYLMLVYLLHR